jgi:hypothetical protein
MWRRTVGRQIYVGRERPLPTGLTVTDVVGRQYSFPTDFMSMIVVFPTNLSVGNVMLWYSAISIPFNIKCPLECLTEVAFREKVHQGFLWTIVA